MRRIFNHMTQLEELAIRCIWWEEPEVSLSDKNRFLAYAMHRCSWEDIRVLESNFSPQEFSEALEKSTPGIMNARSWNYWHLRMGHDSIPPLPVKRIA